MVKYAERVNEKTLKDFSKSSKAVGDSQVTVERLL